MPRDRDIDILRAIDLGAGNVGPPTGMTTSEADASFVLSFFSFNVTIAP
jgi:hypothetical protein